MNLRFINEILINNFSSFDYGILKFWHNFAESTNGMFTNLFRYITFLTEKGIIFIVLAIILMLFKRTRKLGICMFGAIALGAIMTNFILKDSVQRLRPFEFSKTYKQWWTFIGKPFEDDFSFPSCHTTAAAAAMISLFIYGKFGKRILSIIVISLVGISRNYLMAHFPTDVIAGILVGLFAALVACLITKIIYSMLNKYDNKLFKFILNFNLIGDN